jgi:Ca-activated chloride channel family protein
MRGKLTALIGLALVFAPFASLANLYAQSGRNQKTTQRQPTTTRTTNPAQQARPRRAVADATPTPRPSPSPATSAPQGRIPSDPSLLGEPPPWPTPTPTPTPSPAASTAQPAGEEVDAEDVVRINSNLVTVPASVIDAQGRPVTDLKLEDFELRVDGQPKTISELGSSETPVTLALLFDNSSSLTAAREFEKQAAIRFFRSVIRPIDLAAIYSVSTYPTLSQPLTNDVRTLVRTIERFNKPEGATALFDAVVQAANYLRPYQQGRKVIIIVSDGADTISDINFDAALQRAQAADCQIYAVQTGHIENANLRDLAAERRLQDFAGQTGGAVYVPRGTSDLDAAFAQISADLAQQYVLSYYPNDERRDNLFRTISVRVLTRPNLRVRARKGYYPRRAERLSANPQAASRTELVASLEGNAPASVNISNDAASRATRQQQSDVQLSRSNLSADSTAADSSSSSSGPPEPDAIPVNRGANTIALTTIESPAQPAMVRAAEPKTNTTTPTKSESTSAPTATTSAPRAPISGGVLNGKAISLPVPVYPEAARSARVYGIVSVEVIIDEQGKVIEARAVSGQSVLHSSAVAAARRARFAPTKLSGQPVKVTGVIYYRFNLTQ